MPHRVKPRNGSRYAKPPIVPRAVTSLGVIADAEYGRMEQRVYGLEQAVTTLGSQMDRISDHIDTQLSALGASLAERSRTQWPTLISAGALLVTIMSALGVLAYLPVKSAQEELKENQRVINGAIVPRSEHQERWRIMDRDVERLAKAVEQNQERIVPRGEHQEQWASQRTKDEAMSARIDAVAKQFGETYSLKDALKSMQDRLDRIEFNGRAKS